MLANDDDYDKPYMLLWTGCEDRQTLRDVHGMAESDQDEISHGLSDCGLHDGER